MKDLFDGLLDFERMPLNIGIMLYVKSGLIKRVLDAFDKHGYAGCCQGDPSTNIFRFCWPEDHRETEKNRRDLQRAFMMIYDGYKEAPGYSMGVLGIWPVSREHVLANFLASHKCITKTQPAGIDH